MKIRIYFVGIVFVLLFAANPFAEASLNGIWKLHLDVVAPDSCSYEDGALNIQQAGTFFTGTSNLVKIGVGACPPTLMGTIQGNVSPDPTTSLAPFSFFWQFDPTTSFFISGQFTDPTHANGTFNGIYGTVPAFGTWSLTFLLSGAAGATTVTPWGLVILTVLAGLGAVYYLRKRRTTVS
jgi:hypothetical protein